jgi:rhodanese-related sulfurtransferase
MLDRKEGVTVIDVRRPEDYAKSHIPATAPALLYLPTSL